MKNLSERLKNEAIGLGMCDRYRNEWVGTASKDEMAEKFVRAQDFCIRHDWPTPEFIKKNFGDIMHAHGIFADESFNVSGVPTLICVGKCDGFVILERNLSSDIYVRHQSKLRVDVRGISRAFVSIYDDAEVWVSAGDRAKAFVYIHGKRCKAHTEGDVVIRNK